MLDELVKRVGQAEERRNRVVHSVWAGNLMQEAAIRFKPTVRRSRDFNLQFEFVPVDELNATTSFIAEVPKHIGNFVKDYLFR